MIKRLEELFLGIARVTILLVMALGLLGAIGLGGAAVYEYSKKPVEPAPAQKAPEKEISIDNLLKSLEPKKDDGKQAARPDEGVPKTEAAPLYLDEVTKLYQCSLEFARKVGAEIDDASGDSARIERLRAQLEEIAKRPDYGLPYIQSAVMWQQVLLLRFCCWLFTFSGRRLK